MKKLTRTRILREDYEEADKNSYTNEDHEEADKNSYTKGRP